MKIEKNYDFRQRFDEVHKPNRRDYSLKAESNEFVISEDTVIVVPADADSTVMTAAHDLQDYFFKSMDMSLKLKKGEACANSISYAVSSAVAKDAFILEVTANGVKITGNMSKDAFCGSVYLEDQLNLREAPYIEIQTLERKKLFTPRIVHSGWGIELFPDSHLNAIAHAGFDAVVVFVTGIDKTNVGVLDINNLIARAKNYGLGTVLYSYLPAYKHPDEPDAAKFFDSVYGNLFRYYPEAIGVMLVGESAQFPSKDPRTTGKRHSESVVDGIPDVKPAPGWFPCEDYPRWIKSVADAVHAVKKDALVIFNTYNWGWTEEKVRREFLEKMPTDVVIQVTFEIFKSISRGKFKASVMDYTISEAEPGFYFTSECAIAKKCGIPLLATANTAGLTWDFGSIGHVPVPQQWMKKFDKLNEARENWDLLRFYDNHHYGWEPSIICDLGKAAFWAPQVDMKAQFKKLLVRDYGAGAELMEEGYAFWSEAINYFTPTNEDQYGPFRVGPSYPFIFQPNITRTMRGKEIQFPTKDGAHFGWHIIKTMYQPFENINQVPGNLRHPEELASLRKMLELWEKGIAKMEEALKLIPERKKETAERELNLGRYIRANIITGINMKEWYTLNMKLRTAETVEESNAWLDKIEALAQKEIANAKEAIPFVELDSRLGWEPSMEYVTDRWHIEWKLRQMESMLREVNDYRTCINLQ